VRERERESVCVWLFVYVCCSQGHEYFVCVCMLVGEFVYHMCV